MKNHVKSFGSYVSNGRVNETYQDLLQTMEIFQEPLNRLDELRSHLRGLSIEGVEPKYIEEKYGDRVNEILLDLDRLKREFQDDDSMWQRQGRFREDAEKRSEEVWKRMADTQAENERRYREMERYK